MRPIEYPWRDSISTEDEPEKPLVPVQWTPITPPVTRQLPVGPYWPEWTGPEEPGARSPSAWLERRNVGLRGATNNGSAILFYWWVPTDRPNLRLGSRKGAYCPKWEA